MTTTSFGEWIQRHKPTQLEPDHERVLSLIRQAGPNGISWQSLVDQIDLDHEILVQLVQSYSEMGWIRACREGGKLMLRMARPLNDPTARLGSGAA